MKSVTTPLTMRAMRRIGGVVHRLARRAGTSSVGRERSPGRGRWRAFLSSTDAGGMAISLALVLSFVASTGALMTNYAWREAQWEELEASQRAAVAALGPLLGENAADSSVAERLVEYVEALQPGFEATTPTITRGADDVVSVTFGGTYTVDDIWGGGSGGGIEIAPNTVRVKFEHERYEIAMALDVSYSMGCATGCEILGDDGPIRKLDALKKAMEAATDALRTSTQNTPGALAVSVVPYAALVNVADTATAGETTAKLRYLRMLAGAQTSDAPLTKAQLLAAARDDAAIGMGQWVDTFHGYGVGADMGPLRSRGLPADLLNDIDWNLRRRNVAVPVGDQFARADPTDRIWTVDDEDFWNGCLMARWGAYWNPAGRPQEFAINPVDPAYWPYKTDVAGWSPAAPELDDVPVHLSDEPPDRSNPHTLFTAYSWPDASIAVPDDDTGPAWDAGSADHWLQVAMARLLDTGPRGTQVRGHLLTDLELAGHNHWNRPGGGGHGGMCPGTPITPLTDDIATVQSAIANLAGVDLPLAPDPHLVGATYLVRGLVWALRTVSPLWEPVWKVEDVSGRPRPGRSCAPGETGPSCDPLLSKSILLVTDGQTNIGTAGNTGLPEQVQEDEIPPWRYFLDPVCGVATRATLPLYHAAWSLTTPNEFNAQFANNGASALTADRRFDVQQNNNAPAALSDAFTWPTHHTGFPGSALADFTPWELFRGPETSAPRKTGPYQVATDMLMGTTGLRGRPTRLTGYCRPVVPFGPYGGMGDHVLIGEDDTKILPPVPNVGPFRIPETPPSAFRDLNVVYDTNNDQLNTWFFDACRLAGQRGVRVDAIYIGERSSAAEIAALERCVDAAGGDPSTDEVYVTPSAEDLKRSFERIFSVRRNLRFLS